MIRRAIELYHVAHERKKTSVRCASDGAEKLRGFRWVERIAPDLAGGPWSDDRSVRFAVDILLATTTGAGQLLSATALGPYARLDDGRKSGFFHHRRTAGPWA